MADTARELTEPDAMSQMRRSVYISTAPNSLKIPKMPKMSKGNIIREGSVSELSVNRAGEQRVQYENTFRLEPVEGQEFKPSAVRKILIKELESYLSDVKYTRENDANHCRVLCTNIKNEVKKLSLPRFKIVVNVMLSENRGQGLVSASRAIWNDKIDNYAFAKYHNDSLVAVAMVHGVYFD